MQDNCNWTTIRNIKIGEFLCSHFNVEDKNMQHFCNIGLYYFKKGKNATEMQKKNCAVCGQGAVIEQTC